MQGALNLEYVRPEALAAYLQQHEGQVLGVMGFGAEVLALGAGGLILPGTASIVGHETVRKGDVEQQTLETIRNIRTLLKEAYPDGSAQRSGDRLQLKVYIRNALDTERAFGPQQQTVYLQSDICRTDLLVEIERVHLREKSA